MAKKVNGDSSSTRLFSVERILKQYSDYTHPLTAQDIQRYLECYGLKDVVCRTINNDVERIAYVYDLLDSKNTCLKDPFERNYGHFEVVAIPKKGSFIQGKLFNDAELKLIYEMIQNFHFLTINQKESLIRKIYSNCSNVQIKDARAYQSASSVAQLHRYIEGKDTLDNMCKVLSAISKGKQINFDYAHYRVGLDGVKKIYEQKMVYPIEIFLNDGLVYMCAFAIDDKRKPKHYRLDKMNNITVFKTTDGFEDQDLAELCNKAHNHIDGFGNYGDEIKLELLANENILDPLIERFNIYENLTITQNIGNDYDVKLTVEKVPSGDGLIKFLLGFKNQIKIIGPFSLVSQIKEIVNGLHDIYLK